MDPNYVVEVMNEIIGRHKVSQVLYSDSLGCITPEAMRYSIKKIKSGLRKETPISVHHHNDYGLASASTVAAVTGGATYIDVSINGIGDKGGRASLAEAVIALEVLHGVKTGIRLEKLSEMSRLVEEKTGIPNEPYKGLTGKESFVYEAEKYVIPIMETSIETTPYLIRAINPELVGQRREITWGATTLRGEALERKLGGMGLEYTAGDVNRIIEIMKQRLDKLSKYPVYLTDPEVEEICKEALKKK